MCGGGVGRKQVRAFLQKLLRVRETHDPQLAAYRVDPVDAFENADIAIGGDADVMVGRLEYDRAAGAEHGIASRRHELALIVDLQSAVAGITLAGCGLHNQETAAIDRDIERVLGLLGGTLREVLEAAAVEHEADGAIPADEVVFTRAGLQVFLKQRLVGFVTVGVNVRDVVGDDIHLSLQHHLPRKSDEKRILHRWFSPSPIRSKPSQAVCRSLSNRRGSPKPRFARRQSESRAKSENRGYLGT